VTFADRNNLGKSPVQEKLEWVTPKISLMDTGDTQGQGKVPNPTRECGALGGQGGVCVPSQGSS